MSQGLGRRQPLQQAEEDSREGISRVALKITRGHAGRKTLVRLGRAILRIFQAPVLPMTVVGLGFRVQRCPKHAKRVNAILTGSVV